MSQAQKIMIIIIIICNYAFKLLVIINNKHYICIIFACVCVKTKPICRRDNNHNNNLKN